MVVSVAHLSIASSGRTRWDGSRSSGASRLGPSWWGQRLCGACWSEGLVAGEHVPDRLCQAAGDVDLGDPGAALAAEAAFHVLVALAIDGVSASVGGGF